MSDYAIENGLEATLSILDEEVTDNGEILALEKEFSKDR